MIFPNTTRTSATVLSIVALAVTWFFFGGGASAMDVTVSAGEHARPAGPVSLAPREGIAPDAVYLLSFQGKKGPSPVAQSDHSGRLWWWSPPMKPGQKLVYALAPLPPGKELAAVVVTAPGDEPNTIRVTVGGEPFTVFNYKPDESKPYLYPVLASTGDPVTRDYPMKDNPHERELKRQDHHHHRSLWCAHGDIRTHDFDKPGANYWHEPGDTSKWDREKVKRIIRTVSGPVFGQIEAEIEWVNHTGQRDFTEIRTYTFFAGDGDARVIDVRNVFKFTDSDVVFGDTKEGGIVALRLATTMDEREEGRMCNANGQIGAAECWGKAAPWCDYIGPVNNRILGVAVLDHPDNFGHPTHWHIRDYGLYTANPFGLSYFEGKEHNGSHRWKKGETAEFDYRVIIHRHYTHFARIADLWQLYSDPPAVTAE